MIVYIPFSGVTAQSPVWKHLSIRLMKALPVLVWNCLDISVEWWVEHISLFSLLVLWSLRCGVELKVVRITYVMLPGMGVLLR